MAANYPRARALVAGGALLALAIGVDYVHSGGQDAAVSGDPGSTASASTNSPAGAQATQAPAASRARTSRAS